MWSQLLIALLAGASMPLAFAPYSFWPMVVVSPALLIFQQASIDSPRRTFMLGGAFGLGYFGFGVSWIYNSLHVYGHAPPLVAGALTGLMIVTLSLFIAAALYLYKRLTLRYRREYILWSLPLIWFAMEWLKGWVLTGFPWLSIGYAHSQSPLAGFAPLIGVYGLGSLSILISILLVRWWQLRNHGLLLVILLISVCGMGLQQIDWTQASGESLSISMIQGNIPQEMKWRREDRQRIIETYWNATQQHWGSDLIVWPEAAIPGRSEDLQQHLLMPISRRAADNGSNLLTGILMSDNDDDRYYNSMLLLGENQGVYHKRHLVPFGEYYPFRSLLSFMRGYIQIPMSDMSAGPDRQPLMSVKGVKLGVSICFEDVFSRDINLDLPAANILVNTSNDAWFGDSLAPHQHLEIAQMRSLETARPMVRSTNTGQSAFIDHRGRLIKVSEQFMEQSLSARLQGRSGSTPFLAFEKIQPWLALLILLLLLFFIFKRSSLPGASR